MSSVIVQARDIQTEEFIRAANLVHNGHFSYAQSHWRGDANQVTITCPDHGDFQQVVSRHLEGGICPICAGNGSIDTNEFIRRASRVHGRTYLYHNVKYINDWTKVLITCPDHGDFRQAPSHHLQNRGCPECAKISRSIIHRSTSVTFIRKARLIHGDEYDYSKVDYTVARAPVTIICRTHGEFSQSPNNHLNGRGCPTCRKPKKLKEN